MQTAFLAAFLLPPPATGALWLTGLDRPCAGLAANGGIAARVQRIGGNGVLGNQRLQSLGGKISQRVELDKAARFVPFSERDCLAVFRLVAPQAGDPGICAVQSLGKRHHLACMAAGFARLNALVEAVQAIGANIGLDIAGFRFEALDRKAVALLGRFKQFQCLGEQAPGLQRHHLDGASMVSHKRGDQLIL
jgi:hypothetical protein